MMLRFLIAAAVSLIPLRVSAQTQEEQDLLNRLLVEAMSSYSAKDYSSALSIFEIAYALTTSAWPEDDLEVVTIENNLAQMYVLTGQYAKAEPLYLHALEISEQVLGTEHPDTLASLNNLAYLYHSEGRYTAAEPLYRRALEARERVLGPEHPDTLSSVHNLGALYESMGRYADAEPFYHRALNASERVLGREDPDTLMSVNNLAALYKKMNRYAEAELLYLRALKARERVLGREHPDTLMSVNNLAMLFQAIGRYAEAEPLSLRALEGYQRVLGPEHPYTLISVNNLAMLYDLTGRYAEAEPLYERALTANERVLGPVHPQTLSSVNNLAVLYKVTRRYAEAEPLYLRALEANEQVLGPDHPQTLAFVNNLAALYEAENHYTEAELLYKRALETYEQVLGPEHPQTLTSVNNLAGLYRSMGRYADAEPLYQRTLKALDKVSGSEDRLWQASLNNLAWLYHITGHYGEAEPLYVRALDASKRVFGPEHPSTLNIAQNFALLRLSSGEVDAVRAAVLDLGRVLNAWPRRVGQEVQAGASDGLRTYLGEESTLRDVTVSAALQFPEHANLGARALLMTKGVTGETDAALSRLVASDPSDAVRDAAEALQRAESILHASYQSNDPAIIRPAREERDDARRTLFRLVDPPQAFDPESITPQAVVAALPKGTLFLDYGIFQPMSFISGNLSEPHIVVAVYQSGQEVQLLDLGPAAAIADAVIATTNARDRTASLEREHWVLHSILLDPIRAMLADAQEVMVAPDGMLARVNFAMLQDPEDTNRHLVQRLPVRVVASGRTLLEQPQKAPQPHVAFLGAALSNFGKYDQARCETSRVARSEGGLCPLPNAVREVKQILELFDSGGAGGSVALLEENATEAAVAQAMPGKRIIHLATHGGVQLAGYSGEGLHNVGLAFYGISARSADETFTTAANDGILSGYEASRLALWGTDLVAMSACDTALGNSAGTEGIWSMANAFRLAGASATMMTLWKVSDDTAPVFMEHFYQSLLDRQAAYPGEPVHTTMSTALNHTRVWAIDEGWSYWDYGPFVLVEN